VNRKSYEKTRASKIDCGMLLPRWFGLDLSLETLTGRAPSELLLIPAGHGLYTPSCSRSTAKTGKQD
jgi:hypothetical protein